jgi:hypothetical protein
MIDECDGCPWQPRRHACGAQRLPRLLLLLASILQPLACLGFEVGFISVSCSYNDQLHIFIFRMIHTRRARDGFDS